MEKLLENIEKAAEKLVNDMYDPYEDVKKYELLQLAKDSIKSDFAKEYHTQGMYSRKEVKLLIAKAIGELCTNSIICGTKFDDWFEQNKKK